MSDEERRFCCESILNGSDVNQADENGRALLHHASYDGHLNCIKTLISNGADVNLKGGFFGYTPLHEALTRYNSIPETAAECARYLISNGAEVNAKDRYGCVPLFYAAERGNLEYVQLLISNGADVNVKNDSGNTPLHHSCMECKSPECIGTLILNGANPNEMGNNGFTPLYLCCRYSQPSTGNTRIEEVLFLISNGANVNARNREGQTPLHAVDSRHSFEIVKILIANGAEINAKDNSGSTMLHYLIIDGGVKSQMIEQIKFLILNGADIYIKDNKEKTPIDYLKYFSEEEIDEIVKTALDVQSLDIKEPDTDCY